MKKWYLSLFLFVSYVGIFNLWIYLSQSWIRISGISLCFFLSALILSNHRKKYFQNSFDLFLHLVVVLDIFLEAVLPIEHNHYHFYWCALAFVGVVGGYRAYLIHRQQTIVTEKEK